jgi:hypothetical protein
MLNMWNVPQSEQNNNANFSIKPSGDSTSHTLQPCFWSRPNVGNHCHNGSKHVAAFHVTL